VTDIDPAALPPEVIEAIRASLADRYEQARVLKVEELARLWNVSDSTVRRRISAGEVPVVRIGSCLGVTQADAIAFIRQNTYGKTA
jgi:excisionase family DNA binding protein